MIDAARDAINFAAARDREDLDTDRMLALALVKSIEIVGEAGTRISPQGRKPDVPWRQIVAMRNRLIHAYFDVNLDVIWETVRNDLPTLILAAETSPQGHQRLQPRRPPLRRGCQVR